MRKIFVTAAALLMSLPAAPLLAQHHGGGGGGGGGHPGGGGGGHPGGGGGGGGGFHGGGGGGFHGGGGGFHGGGGAAHGGGAHFGGGGGGGGEHRAAISAQGGHFGAEHRGGAIGGRGGDRTNVVVNNRTVVRNDAFRGDAGGRGGHGLPAGPGRGAWHQGWYGGHVNGFRPVHAGFYRYPSGWGYRRWGIGLVLPAVLFGSAYYYYNWHSLGAYPPPPGDRWVRYGPDLLLVNVPTGRVDDAIYGAFY